MSAGWSVTYEAATIQAGTALLPSSVINLVSDLGVKQREPTFYGRLIMKPGRKHRIVVEGTPVKLHGMNTVSRTVIYRGQTFTVGETLESSADVNYFFGGYQYLRDYDSQPGTDPGKPRTYEQNKAFGKLTWRLAPGWQVMQSVHEKMSAACGNRRWS